MGVVSRGANGGRSIVRLRMSRAAHPRSGPRSWHHHMRGTTFRAWTRDDSARSTSTGSTRRKFRALLERRDAIFSDTDAAVVRPLGFQLSDGRAYTYVPAGKTFSVRPGTDAAQTVVELSADAWCAFVWELKTCFALLYADELTVLRGGFGQMARWEPPLRVAFSNQALFDIDHPARMEDEAGREMDLTKSFTLEDSATEIREFLQRVGFAHLRAVLDAAEVEGTQGRCRRGPRPGPTR